ncbi:MAG: hypothetical protein ABSC90_05020 [Acidimicrobiales bacterium]|jgi:hypothetical protein
MAPDLRFDTDDPEFQRGFEIGVLWERLVTDGACNMAVSASNAEMVIRVAQAFGCRFSGQEIEDDQISVELYQMHGQ